MEQSFKINHLLLPEINYELKIRETFTDKPMSDKRKILGRLLAKEKQQGFDCLKLKDKDFDFTQEKSEIEITLKSVENLISEFEGPSTDSGFARATTRLIHVTNRIKRLPVEGDVTGEISSYKNEAYASAIKLEADLYERVKDPIDDCLNSTIDEPSVTTRNLPFTLPSHVKPVPVYKLGIHFDGNPFIY